MPPADTAYSHGGNIHALAAKLGLGPEKILDFSASINPLAPARSMTEAITANLKTLLVNYPAPRATRLAAALADKYGQSPENVLIGNGATELIHLLPRLFPGGRGLIIGPAFGEYAAGLAAAGLAIDWHLCPPEEGLVPDFGGTTGDNLKKKIESKYNLVFLGRPANPGGGLCSGEVAAELAQRTKAAGGYVVVDEAFIDFCPDESIIHLMGKYPNIIIIGSMTKFYGLPGLRLGHVFGPAGLIARLTALQPPWSVNALAEAAGLAGLADEAFAEESRRLIGRLRPALAAGLAELGLTVFDSAANYLLVRLGPGQPPAAELAERLALSAIMIRDCGNYAGLGPEYFRVSVRMAEDNARLLAALA